MRIALIALLAVGAVATPAAAHPEGDFDQYYRPPPPVRKTIPQQAQESVVKLVTQAKLPASWASVQPLTSVMRTRKGVQQWVVTFRNAAIRNKAQSVLYVLMSTDGTFISANHKLV